MNATPDKIRRALVSVSDKTGIADFCAALAARGIALVSTGGSAQALGAAGLAVTEVAEVTGVPEFLDGRVKTLHPAIHGGLLARRDRPDHLGALSLTRDCTNRSPGVQPLSVRRDRRRRRRRDDCIENIDIGGLALIRRRRQEPRRVMVVADRADYWRVLAALADGEGLGRTRAAARAGAERRMH